MPRIKIALPDVFPFACSIPVRITDINYGGHVGNDAILSLLHEARMQYFNSLGYTEMNFGGTGLIMSDVGIEFKNELFYGDTVIASVGAGDISRVGFDIVYKLEKKEGDTIKHVASAKTGMICFDYEKKRMAAVPTEALERLRFKV